MNNKLIICYYLKYIEFNFFSKINFSKYYNKYFKKNV